MPKVLERPLSLGERLNQERRPATRWHNKKVSRPKKQIPKEIKERYIARKIEEYQAYKLRQMFRED